MKNYWNYGIDFENSSFLEKGWWQTQLLRKIFFIDIFLGILHMKFDTKEKPYLGCQCNIFFLKNSNIIRFMLIHTGKKNILMLSL